MFAHIPYGAKRPAVHASGLAFSLCRISARGASVDRGYHGGVRDDASLPAIAPAHAEDAGHSSIWRNFAYLGFIERTIGRDRAD